MRYAFILFGVSILTVFSFVSCTKNNAAEQAPLPNANLAKSTRPAASDCNPALWEHVYDPERLEVIDKCKVVTGVIEEQDQNEDGDTHMLLKLDPGQDSLVNNRNLKKKNGDLVVEVVCANAVSDKKAKEACTNYSNAIPLPKVGDHATVTGSYVNDSHNGWMEIHPVSGILVR
jgi:hypothetical protein